MRRPLRVAMAALALSMVVAFPSAAFARGKSCHEVSDIVGFEHCTRYGNGWALERSAPFAFELTLGGDWLDTVPRTLQGSFGKNQKGSFQYPGGLVGHSLGVGTLGMRFDGYFVPWAYAGIELDFGVGSNSLPRTSAGGYSIAPSDGQVNSFGFGGGLFGGLRVPLGYLSLRLESLFGGRAIMAGQAAQMPPAAPRDATVSLSAWSIEPRAFLDVWVEPWMTLSGFGGVNALHYQDHFGGVAIGFHGRSYDGAFLW